MKRTLAIVLGCGAASAAGIGAWYFAATQRAEANLQDAIDRSQQQRPAKVTFVVTPPPGTPSGQLLYLSGSSPALGNWEAAGVPLVSADDGMHRVTVELLASVPYEYKVTRGTWGTVERSGSGEDIPNRTVEVRGEQTVNVAVGSWIDKGQSIPGRITISGEIRVHRKFRSQLLGNERDIAVYLPPGYNDNGESRYGVLYMHDGQNLFNEADAYAGVEWGVDEAAQRLIVEGTMAPIIIVGIYNTPDRAAEFDPSGRGKLYGQFLCQELKPFIDRIYRTRPQREHTGLAGAGLGGLITLQLAVERGDVFGRVAAMSPWLRVGDKPIHTTWDAAWGRDVTLWLDVGLLGGENFPVEAQVSDAQELAIWLESTALTPHSRFKFQQWPDARQDEAGWAATIDHTLLFLFPAQ